MTLEQVVEALKRCTQDPSVGTCAGCPYEDVGDTFAQCCLALMFDCLDLLKAQEPHVVKMSELTAGEPMLVWLEDIDKEETVAGMIFDYVPGRLGFKLTDLASMDRIYPLIDEYLTRWRCWTSRPDKATREATPWE